MKVVVGYLDEPLGYLELKEGEIEIHGTSPVLQNILTHLKPDNISAEEFLKNLPKMLRNHYWAYIKED